MRISRRQKDSHSWQKSLLSGLCGLGSICLMADVALAGYVPPAPIAPKKLNPIQAWWAKLTRPVWAKTTTGTRGGCSSESALDFTAIAPSSHPDGHVGLSGRDRPSVVWFVPDEQPLEMDFIFYELIPNGEGRVASKTLFRQKLQSQPGWMRFQIPDDAPALSVDGHYGWKAVLYCRTRRKPSAAQAIAAELKIQPGLTEGFENNQSPVEQANFWAAQGLWYDAISVLAKQQGSVAQRQRQALLSDLVELEQSLEHSKDTQEQLERLQKLATQE